MSQKENKAPRLLDDSDPSGSSINHQLKRPRTREDFYKFCQIVLEYVNYDSLRQEEEARANTRTPTPLDSSGSSVNSESATSSGQEDKHSEDDTDVESEKEGDNNEDDSYDLVTCYCRKPFAGRPMIECSRCLTWVHLSCARIRRNHIPDVFFCALCKSKRHRPLRGTDTSSVRSGKGSSSPGSPQQKKMKRSAN